MTRSAPRDRRVMLVLAVVVTIILALNVASALVPGMDGLLATVPVIVAILAIFFFIFREVTPLFATPTARLLSRFTLSAIPSSPAPLKIGMDDGKTIAYVLISDGVRFVDLSTGLYATIAILAALRERDSSGEGQYIDMALFDTCAALSSHQAAGYFLSGKIPQRMGTSSVGIMLPYETFRCADGHLIVAVGNDSQWRGLCQAIGRHDLMSDPRLSSPSGRATNRDFVMPELRKTFAQQPVADLQSKLDAAGVPNGPINNLEQVFEMPQAAERQLKIDVPRSDGVRVAGVRNPIRLSATPVEYRHAAPRLGEHTDAVLAEWLEADSAEIARLRASGAFGQ